MSQSREFHDLSERLLNAESGYRTLWGNLGYWLDASTYPEACESLARQLAKSVELKNSDDVVDIGFGCGDQLLLWLNEFQVADLSGLNLSRSQTRHAREKLSAHGYDHIADKLYCGDIQAPPDPVCERIKGASVILALDCAYHFPNRAELFQFIARQSPPHCRFAYTDIVLARKPGLFENLLLRIMLKLSRIPHDNVMQEQAYRTQLNAAGWHQVSMRDLTDHVFLPFAAWLKQYRGSQIRQGVKACWKKYQGTAMFLRWAARRRLLKYQSIVISK